MSRASLTAVVCSTLFLLTLSTGCPIVPLGIDPPGDVIDGTGAVVSSVEARSRVLLEVLGATGYDASMLGDAVIATGDSPYDDVYQVPGGALAGGAKVADPFGEYEPFSLGEAYYIFWIDPAPYVELGHASMIAYVRASDGRITKQTVEFPPIINDAESLFFSADRGANRIYRHELTELLFINLTYDAVQAVIKTGTAQEQTTDFGGLFVCGTDEPYRPVIQEAMDEMFGALSGDPKAKMDAINDSKDDRLDKDKLGKALKKASEGLGEGDKFVFVLSSHGSKGGQVRIGKDLVTWEELCKLITDNVTAENICVFLDPCYSGLGLETFKKWDSETTAGMTVWSATDSAKPALALFPTLCAARELREAFGGAENTTPQTPAAIKAAIEKLDITAAELKKKVCDLLEAAAKQGAAGIAATFTPFKAAVDTVGGSQVGGFDSDDPAPPSSDPNTPFIDPFSPFGPLFGNGTTNDGGGIFDLSGGELTSGDGGDSVDLKGTMQITNQVGHDAGSFDLHGTLRSRQRQVHVYDADGTMRVFTGGQLETLNGTLTVTFGPGSVLVEFVGTHTDDQAAAFNLSGDRP